MVVAARFILFCAALLTLPAIVAAQTPPPHLEPGWYKNSGPAIIHEDSELRITWENSYVYPYPGRDTLYWYTEVVYLYKGTQTFDISCVGEGFEPVGEHMRGTPNSGFVAAEETLCSRNRQFTVTLKPGEVFIDWVIFHNVPWIGGEVRLQWPAYESWQDAQWVDPWSSPFSASPPAECPTELVTLRTCAPAIRCPSADFIFPVKSGYIGWLYEEPTDGIDPSGLHSGLDFWVAVDTPVMAVATGYVSRGPKFSDIENSYNLGIYYPSLDVETYTNNLINLEVNTGSTVKAGTVIGYAGSYGAHFHWSVDIKGYNDQSSDWGPTTPHLDPTQYLTPAGNLNFATGAQEDRSAPLYSWCNIVG